MLPLRIFRVSRLSKQTLVARPISVHHKALSSHYHISPLARLNPYSTTTLRGIEQELLLLKSKPNDKEEVLTSLIVDTFDDIPSLRKVLQFCESNSFDVSRTIMSQLISERAIERDWDHVVDIGDELKNCNVNPYPIFLRALVTTIHQREISIARDMLNGMAKLGFLKNTFAYSTLLKYVISFANVDMILSIIHEAKENEIEVEVLYNQAVQGFSRRRDSKSVHAILDDMKANGIEKNSYTYNALISLYTLLDDSSSLHDEFEEMKRTIGRDTLAYNAIIKYYSKKNDVPAVVRHYGNMAEEGIERDVGTYTTVISLMNRFNYYQQMEKVKHEAQAANIPLDQLFFAVLTNSYAKQDNEARFSKAFEEMKKRKIIPDADLYFASIGFYGKRGDAPKLAQVFQEMYNNGIRTNAMQFDKYITKPYAFRDPATQEKIAKSLEEMIDQHASGLAQNSLGLVYSILVGLYIRTSNITKAIALFETVQSLRNVSTYNVLFKFFTRTKEYKREALQLWEMMQDEPGVFPNELTYRSLFKIFKDNERFTESLWKKIKREGRVKQLYLQE